MTNSIFTNAAADVIADIDPKLATMFRNNPFQRDAIISALHKSLSQCSLASMADEITVTLRSMMDKHRAQMEEMAQ